MKHLNNTVLALYFLGCILYAPFVQVALAQPKGQKETSTSLQPLELALRHLQERYQIYFNYNHQIVQNKQVSIDTLLVPEANLDQYLADLLRPTGLKVEKQRNRRYLIYKDTAPTTPTAPPAQVESKINISPATATLTGRVVDVLTGEPLPFATVYINTTTRGTTTGEDGIYRLTNIPVGTIELVASYLGYETSREVVRITGTTTRRVNFFLKSAANELGSVTIVGRKSRVRQRQLRKFFNELLGQSSFSNRCVLLNDSVVQFSEDRGKLLAKASAPLIIENRALGYRIYYDMTRFDTYRLLTHYAGTAHFEEMTPESPEQARHWEQNRETAYKGSTRHLIASMIAGTHEQEGFLVYQSNMPLSDASYTTPILQFSGLRRSLPISSDSLFKPGELTFERVLSSHQPLEIFNTRIRTRNSPYSDMPYAYSLLYLPKGQAVVTTSGWVSTPMGMEIRGYLGHDRLARLLPTDWSPAVKDTNLLAKDQTKSILLQADLVLDSLAKRWRFYQQKASPGIFLHIDKPVYTTGDTLWLSAYELNKNEEYNDPNTTGTPADPQLQPALQVELLTQQGQQIAHQWLPIHNDRSSGYFRLSDTLTTGTYRLRAYTEADRFSPVPPFERNVLIHNWGQVVEADSTHSPTNAELLDVQFLPEGGRWIIEHPTRLGIKILDTKGRGKAVKGKVVDTQGKEVTSFTTNPMGMGSVTFSPIPNQTYRALIDTSEYRLPQAEAEGYTLRADWLSDTTRLMVHIQASKRYQSEPAYLILQSRGIIQQKTKLQLQDGKATIAYVTDKLPAGISQVTLFDVQGRPWAERLVYVPEQYKPIRVEVIPEKTELNSGEQASYLLRVLDGGNFPLAATLSVSVTDAAQQPADTADADIRTHLLLSGELRGHIENPRYYTNSTRSDTRQALDDLLLTQGWRRLSWQELPADPSKESEASTSSVVLRGQVVDLRSRPVPNAKLLFTFTGSAQSFSSSVQADAEGNFTLGGLVLNDTNQVRVVTMNHNLKPIKARVVLDTPGIPFKGSVLPVEDNLEWSQRLEEYLAKGRVRQETALDLYREKGAHQLGEITIRGEKDNSERSARRSSIHGAPDAAIDFDYTARNYTNVLEMLAGKVPGISISRKPDGGSNESYSVLVRGASSFGNSSPMYLLDGVSVEQEVLLNISPIEVERVEVIKNGGGAIYGARGGAGVIAFYTKKSRPGKLSRDDNADLVVQGFSAQRDFYVPKYIGSTSVSKGANLRDVLFWQPLLTISSTGTSTFQFPLSDTVQTLRITIQGLTTSGDPVSQVRIIKVR